MMDRCPNCGLPPKTRGTFYAGFGSLEKHTCWHKCHEEYDKHKVLSEPELLVVWMSKQEPHLLSYFLYRAKRELLGVDSL